MRIVATSDKALLAKKELLNPVTMILRSSKWKFISRNRKTSYTQAFNSTVESLSSALCQVPWWLELVVLSRDFYCESSNKTSGSGRSGGGGVLGEQQASLFNFGARQNTQWPPFTSFNKTFHLLSRQNFCQEKKDQKWKWTTFDEKPL